LPNEKLNSKPLASNTLLLPPQKIKIKKNKDACPMYNSNHCKKKKKLVHGIFLIKATITVKINYLFLPSNIEMKSNILL